MLLTRVLILAGILAGLPACFASRPDDPPPIVAVRPDTASGDTWGRHVIGLQRVQVDIPRGTHIGDVRSPPLSVCYGSGMGSVQYGSGRSDVEPKEWQDVFHRVMSGHGYRVAGSPSSLFEERDEDDAEYMFGANITEMNINGTVLCDFITAEAKALNGSSRIMVQWQVFNPVQRRVVLKETIEGRYTTDRAMPIDHMLMAKMAFADSVNKLAAKASVREIIAARPAAAAAAAVTAGSPPDRRELLPRLQLFTGQIEAQMDRLRAATVIIETGQGLGSGFVVSQDGMIVTNQHVVGGQKSVRVTLVSGQTLVGTVMRRDVSRDVALVKIDGQGYAAIPIREGAVRIAEDVYAIGAPKMKQLGWTVTRGVVSALRPARPPTQSHDLIQADVAIHPGNSGGPLLDRQGNLVGISVAGYGRNNQSLNMFIPILDGLDKLGIELVDQPEYDRRRKLAGNPRPSP